MNILLFFRCLLFILMIVLANAQDLKIIAGAGINILISESEKNGDNKYNLPSFDSYFKNAPLFRFDISYRLSPNGKSTEVRTLIGLDYQYGVYEKKLVDYGLGSELVYTKITPYLGFGKFLNEGHGFIFAFLGFPIGYPGSTGKTPIVLIDSETGIETPVIADAKYIYSKTKGFRIGVGADVENLFDRNFVVSFRAHLDLGSGAVNKVKVYYNSKFIGEENAVNNLKIHDNDAVISISIGYLFKLFR